MDHSPQLEDDSLGLLMYHTAILLNYFQFLGDIQSY